MVPLKHFRLTIKVAGIISGWTSVSELIELRAALSKDVVFTFTIAENRQGHGKTLCTVLTKEVVLLTSEPLTAES